MNRKTNGKRAKTSRQRPTGRKTNGKARNQKPTGQMAVRNVQTAPSVVGMVLPRASMSRGGKAQALVDQDSGSSERVTGTDLFDLGVWSSGSGGNLGFASATGVATPPQFANLTPSLISTRLQAIEEMYQWYAIRRLKIHFITATGTSSTGSAAFGISTDPELAVAFSTPSQQQVVELNPSVLMPIWSISSIEYKHHGTKLWETYASSTEVEDTKIQATLFVSGHTSLGSEVLNIQIWIEYEIDFYQQAPLLSSVDLFRLGKTCPRCRQLVACDPRERKKKERTNHDDYVVLRAQEPSTGVFQGLQTYQGLESPPIRREESKAQMTARSQSQKG